MVIFFQNNRIPETSKNTKKTENLAGCIFNVALKSKKSRKPCLLALSAAILRKICRVGIDIPYHHKVLRSLVSELPPNAQPLCLTCSGEPFSAFKIASLRSA